VRSDLQRISPFTTPDGHKSQKYKVRYKRLELKKRGRRKERTGFEHGKEGKLLALIARPQLLGD